ncbi:hypothetical protein IW261DRAFT_1568709 [Armillaria novae-zelandiae]|uniref:Uncharacterized protein n=1 Tax=Armillaria novae-zelandiae TaxID=153914 RepID=A0AA39NZR7_9AGAR|nr:hypothetical protein IW261DRAFT_1568709 [Armillaria novae-zelandiae]
MPKRSTIPFIPTSPSFSSFSHLVVVRNDVYDCIVATENVFGGSPAVSLWMLISGLVTTSRTSVNINFLQQRAHSDSRRPSSDVHAGTGQAGTMCGPRSTTMVVEVARDVEGSIGMGLQVCNLASFMFSQLIVPSDDRSLTSLHALTGVQARGSAVIDSLTFGGKDITGNEEAVILLCGDLRTGCGDGRRRHQAIDSCHRYDQWPYNGVRAYVHSGNDTRRTGPMMSEIVRECRQESHGCMHLGESALCGDGVTEASRCGAPGGKERIGGLRGWDHVRRDACVAGRDVDAGSLFLVQMGTGGSEMGSCKRTFDVDGGGLSEA